MLVRELLNRRGSSTCLEPLDPVLQEFACLVATRQGEAGDQISVKTLQASDELGRGGEREFIGQPVIWAAGGLPKAALMLMRHALTI
jgi:hypothetical protein